MTIQQVLRAHAETGVNPETIKDHLLTAAARIDWLEAALEHAAVSHMDRQTRPLVNMGAMNDAQQQRYMRESYTQFANWM